MFEELGKYLSWIMDLGAVYLMSPLQDFKFKITDKELGKQIASSIEDGYLTDEEVGKLLQLVSDQVKKL